MTLATYPAPKPLSIFTTLTLDAPLFSIPSSAAIPLKLAPYPTLVGTAITGADTNPAQHTLDDHGHLLRRLAARQHNLGISLPQRAMMIDLRQSQILERQLAQPFERTLDAQVAASHGLQKFSYVALVQVDSQSLSGGRENQFSRSRIKSGTASKARLYSESGNSSRQAFARLT